ncbi:MAG TPA: Rieske 2Fe-2S domain-containing protein [Verrucomicrobiae bacterium]|nr:Rieske 2Fe-2S domain-containing protein [Verrucomicrobiae bacterium]
MSAEAEAAGYVRVADRGEVPLHGALVVTVGSYDVAIFDLGGALVAYENACPHQGGPIGEGCVQGTTVTCPWHAWCFDLRTGSLTIGAFARLRPFAVCESGGGVYLSPSPVEEP